LIDYPMLATSNPSSWVLYEGTATGVSSSLPFPSTTATAGAYFAAGDTNHDGRADIAFYNQTAGTTVVYPGTSSGVGATVLATFTATGIGAGVGDVNHDGYADLAVVVSAGVAIHLGSATGPSTAAAITVPGVSVYPAGDVNHDGYADMTVQGVAGAPAMLYFGSATGITTAGALAWPEKLYEQPMLPQALRGYEDVDGDGVDDILSVGSLGIVAQRFAPPFAHPAVLSLPAGGIGPVYR
jgi:hypothetical protein